MNSTPPPLQIIIPTLPSESYGCKVSLFFRYPTFVDALRDLDDALTMIHLFATLPAAHRHKIPGSAVATSRRLALEWQAYVVRTNSLRKTFVSVKGFYYQADVQGQTITWLVPHQLAQVLRPPPFPPPHLPHPTFDHTPEFQCSIPLCHGSCPLFNATYPPPLPRANKSFLGFSWASNSNIPHRDLQASANRWIRISFSARPLLRPRGISNELPLKRIT